MMRQIKGADKVEHYFESVLKGFKTKKSKVVLGGYTRKKADFIVMDVDEDGMPEILFGFMYAGDKRAGILKRQNHMWILQNIASFKACKDSGIFDTLEILENVTIQTRQMQKELTLEQLVEGKGNSFIAMIDGVVYKGILEPVVQDEELLEEESDATQEVVDFVQGDVTGEGSIDNISLIGTKDFGEVNGAVKDMVLKVEDDSGEEISTVKLPSGAGYSPILFVGDFTGNGVDNILVNYFTSSNGGFAYSYIYSFLDGEPKVLFDSRKYNERYTGEVVYRDNYKVEVITEKPGKVYQIDISNKDEVYLDKIYNKEGKLKTPTYGNINGIIAVNPADFDSNKIYNLSGVQRITGVDDEDTLALLETFLKYDISVGAFEPFMQYVSLIGEQV